MSGPTGNEAERSIVDELLAEYMQRVDSGENVDREEFLRQHDKYAERLRELLDASDLVDRMTEGVDQHSQAVGDIHDWETWSPGDSPAPPFVRPNRAPQNAPSNDKFLVTLEKSKLLPEELIAKIRRQVANTTAISTGELAQWLVKNNLLTEWQAEQQFFLDKYKLLDFLGEGGMGSVFKAEQTLLQRVVGRH